MAKEIVTEEQRAYVERFLDVLEKNKRHSTRINTQVENIKKSLGTDGCGLYKSAFDKGYPLKLTMVEARIIRAQVIIISELVNYYTLDSIKKLTAKSLEGYKEPTQKILGGAIEKLFANTLFEFLLAFVAVLQDMLKKDEGKFAKVKGCVQYPKERIVFV